MLPNQAHIDTLAARRKAGSDAYYNGVPIMSDHDWDLLDDELRRLDPNHPDLKAVGAPAPTSGAFAKVKHTIPMGSLNKAKNLAEMQTWYAGCPNGKTLIAMDKLDGGSLSVLYVKRKFTQAVTRGDGDIGQDVTRNAMLIQGMVKMLPPTLPDGTPMPDNVWVRGEVIIMHADFKQYFPGESNPRNSANGTLVRQSDNAKCAHLTLKAYNLCPNGVGMAKKSEELTTLAAWGFQFPKWSLCAGMTELEIVYQDYVATIRKNIGYEIDGIVTEFDDLDFRESQGDLGGRPKASVAYKFPYAQAETILRAILDQVGKSGRITPVAIYDEVILGGRKNDRCSLAGYRQVEHLRLFPGCRIIVAMRGDVIPRVEANLDEGTLNDL